MYVVFFFFAGEDRKGLKCSTRDIDMMGDVPEGFDEMGCDSGDRSRLENHRSPFF
jgi:hypothetical protein